MKSAKWLLIIGILLCFVAPILLTQPYFHEIFNLTTTGQIGDTIGGITAPFANLLGAILVFYALRAQINANELIQKQFDEQKADEVNRKKLLYITSQVNMIREEINDFTYSYKDKNYKYNYEGADAINQFLYKIRKGGTHEQNFDEFVKANPKINELISLLKIVNQQIIIIKKENISDFDKKYFASLLEYQYNSKIKHVINTFVEFKRSEQEICTGCNEKHGIPDEIFIQSDKIGLSLAE